jgi:4,4'-diaponeurosporenoate glycosyltransferase
MLIFALLSIAGILAGLLLLRSAPTLPAQPPIISNPPPVSIVIPARNEAANLPRLLESINRSAINPFQIIVVDDHSTDSTAAIGASHEAIVIPSAPLPTGWTGKNWACHQGALASDGNILFFLDADTYFTAGGYAQIIATFADLPANTAVSILPFHRTEDWYEELSLFFNILVAIGAGGFGKLDRPHLFGQSLLISSELYQRSGGHECVKGQILENLHFAAPVRAAGGTPKTFAGRGILETRMFPYGLSQLRESWIKAFATGARASSRLVLALSIVWLTAAMLTALTLAAHPSPLPLVLYFINAAQIAWYARQLGAFRLATALLYPISLAFYFAIFAQSLSLRLRNQPVTWRGRRL